MSSSNFCNAFRRFMLQMVETSHSFTKITIWHIIYYEKDGHAGAPFSETPCLKDFIVSLLPKDPRGQEQSVKLATAEKNVSNASTVMTKTLNWKGKVKNVTQTKLWRLKKKIKVCSVPLCTSRFHIHVWTFCVLWNTQWRKEKKHSTCLLCC